MFASDKASHPQIRASSATSLTDNFRYPMFV